MGICLRGHGEPVNRFDEAMLQLGVAQRSIDWCNHTPVLQAAFDVVRHENWTG